MKKKVSEKTELPKDEKSLQPVREFIDSEEVLKLTKEEIDKLPHKDKQRLLYSLIKLIDKEEKEGYHTRANDLRELIYYLIEKHLKGIQGGVEDYKRQDWEINHSKIFTFIHNYTINNNGFPHINKIAEEVGLSRQTIHEHLKAGISHKFYQEKLKIWEALTDSIYKNLYVASINGSVQASKVLLDNIYRDKQPQTIKQQNNYIQINNTKIDELTIAELPDVAKEKIVEIVNQYAQKKAI